MKSLMAHAALARKMVADVASPRKMVADVATPRPFEVSPQELDKRLAGIRWRLDKASFGELRNKSVEVPRLVEAIRKTTEMLVWGERNGKEFMDLYRRRTMMEGYVVALRTDSSPHQIKLQVMQSLSILMPELRSDGSLPYLFSVLNPIFDVPLNLEDEEIMAYFITLLKGVALRLNADNVQHSLVADSDSFAAHESPPWRMPLLECAVRFIDHADSMVQAAARTAVLNILRLDVFVVRTIVEEVATKLLVPSILQMVRTANKPVDVDELGKICDDEVTEHLLEFVGEVFDSGHVGVMGCLVAHGFLANDNGNTIRLE